MSLDCASDLAEVFAGRRRIAVLAPHPDDESLGCGALLARAFDGAGAHVICLTDGGASHPGSRQWNPERLASKRREELTRAIVHLGGTAGDLTWLGLADSTLCRLDLAGLADEIARHVAACGAQHIFAPALEDHHADHKATAEIARNLRGRRPDWTFYSYPVWSRWDDPEFDRHIARYDPCHLAVGDCRARKRAAIDAHASQLGRVVADDPGGFVLPPAMVEKFVAGDEVFWRMP